MDFIPFSSKFCGGGGGNDKEGENSYGYLKESAV